MATEIAKAYVQIIPSMKGVKGTIEEQLGGAGDEAGKKAGEKAGGGFLSKMGGAIAKGAAVVGTAAATAVGAIAKSAVSGFADYEQLVGGVETLFGKSADVVQYYAENAFKTAGLSANQYMETVTSFSASLLQSLDGDTLQAARAADMAIQDMSDNANKMGTSMESIQNAYQGFAKQNYTMLDNLKLGYGGTKEEMQRLLDDAEKISGIKYDMSSLNDVYSAIHVVQTELGITGTTAEEASKTISGSASQMKAAWQNVLTGMGDSNAQLGTLIDNLVASVRTFADNLLPVVQQSLSGIGRLVAELAPVITAALPELFNSILPGILDAALGIITSLTEALPDMLVTIGTTVATFIAENASTLIQAGIDLVVNLAQGIAESLPSLIPVAIDAVMALFTTLTDPSNLGMMVDAAIQLTFSLATGLIDAIPTLIEKAPEIVASVMQAIIENAPKLLEASLALVVKLAEGIVSNLPKMVESAKKIVKSFVDGIKNLMSSVHAIGKNIVDGVWQGIKNAAATFTANVKNFFKNIVSSVKSALGIKSPSRVFRDQVGKMMAAGIGVGFSDEMENVRRDVLNEVDGLTGNVGTISAGFEASVNTMPIASADTGITGVAQRIIDAINNRETSVKVFLDSKEIRAGQERLSRAMG